MPRIPEKEKSAIGNIAAIGTASSSQDIVRLDMARAEKKRRDRFKKLQMEEKAHEVRDALEIEIDALHENLKETGAEDLTRKSLELINKRVAQETSRLEGAQRKAFDEAFQIAVPDLMRQAAIFENEARDNFIANKILQQFGNVLETGTITTGDDTHQSINDLIEEADLPLDKKQKLTHTIGHTIKQAAYKKKISENKNLRHKVSEGKQKLNPDPIAQAELEHYARRLVVAGFESETQDKYQDFKELEQTLTTQDTSYDALKDRAKKIPPHLRNQLRQQNKKSLQMAKLVRNFEVDTTNQKAGTAYLTALIEDKDIIGDTQLYNLVTSLITTHKITSPLLLEKLRYGAETADTARLEATIDLANVNEHNFPDIFKEKQFNQLKKRMTLVKVLRSRYPEQKIRATALQKFIAPEKPLTGAEIEKTHGEWLSLETSNAPIKAVEKEVYRQKLLSTLVATQGDRELALQLIYHSKNNSR